MHRKDLLTISAAPALKRWIALLCIAVMMLVVVGHTDVASASHPCDAACCVTSDLDDQTDPDDSVPAGAHHCCCTHPVSDHPPAQAGPVRYAEEVPALLSDSRVLSGLLDGPERPPRASAS